MRAWICSGDTELLKQRIGNLNCTKINKTHIHVQSWEPLPYLNFSGHILVKNLWFFPLSLLVTLTSVIKPFFSRRLICARKNVPHVASEDMDEDVAAEHVRVSSGAASSDILQVHELTKVYQHLKKKVHAVKKLSVGIPAGEVSLRSSSLDWERCYSLTEEKASYEFICSSFSCWVINIM